MIKLTLDINDQVAKIEALEKDTQEQVRCTNAYPLLPNAIILPSQRHKYATLQKASPHTWASLGYKFGDINNKLLIINLILHVRIASS